MTARENHLILTADPPGSPASVRDKDDRDGRHYRHPRTGDRLPSVTNVLDSTAAKPHLVPWSAKIAAGYAVDHPYRLIRLKREQGRDAAVAEAGRQAELIRNLKRELGSYVHAVVEALVLWAASPDGTGAEIGLPLLPEHLAGTYYDEDPVESVADWMVTGFVNWVSDFQPGFFAAEMAVFNLTLGVAGTLDLIVDLYGVAIGPAGRLIPAPGNVLRLCVDVKTGRYLDVTMPEQISSYRRMEEALLPMGELIAMPATHASAVLHLRPEYERGYRLILVSGHNDATAWNRFRRALDLYIGRKAAKTKPGKVVYALRADGTMPSPRTADLDGEGYRHVPGALHKAGVPDLEALSGLDEAGCLDLKGIGPKSLPIIRQMLADHGLHLEGETPEPSEATAAEPAKAA